MWYDERGGGEPLVLLHGGAVDSRFFAASIDLLADRFRVFAPDARGHGRTPDVEGPFTHAALARDAIAFLETVAGRPAHLVGHGEGASVAMHVGLRRPDLVNQLVVIGGDVRRDDHVPGDSQNRVDIGAVVAAFGASYGEVSPDGEEHYRVVVEKDVEMLAEGPTVMQSELGGITSRTLVMAGDDDAVPLEHTLALYRGIADSELVVVPGTSHFLVQEKPALCNAIIVEFLTTGPVPTVAPIRRATRPRPSAR